ncbi:glycosyltransferase [Shewanella donghaensis]|uniref:glycosyltransferase n=1 Tax=Shewanella donghaensis TaxID=238836 RepID=UPI00118339B9|nr:glycosyltransferase [Shewanella donghaensis]
MKVALLSAANNVHTVKWANGLALQGVEVHVISLHPMTQNFNSAVHMHILSFKAPFGYFSNVVKLRCLLKKISPDLVNAHYATGYGLLSVLSTGRYPNIISLWGSDIFLFPKRSKFHFWVLKKILSSANAIFSTSECMKQELIKHSFAPNVPVFKTPFGVDVDLFSPNANALKNRSASDKVIVGTVKSLKAVYGIDVLIEAFSMLVKKDPVLKAELQIYGEGIELESLQQLAEMHGVADKVIFGGFIDNKKVPEVLNKFDVYAALSRSESFGVAVLEASACGVPVVVSDAEGFLEVVSDGVTGLIVPKNDPVAAHKALESLIVNPKARYELGEEGRKSVKLSFSETACIDIMMSAYKQVIKANH